MGLDKGNRMVFYYKVPVQMDCKNRNYLHRLSASVLALVLTLLLVAPPVSDESLTSIISNTNESGVRMLKQRIETAVMNLNVLRFIPNKNINIDFTKPIILTSELVNKLVKYSSNNDLKMNMYI